MSDDDDYMNSIVDEDFILVGARIGVARDSREVKGGSCFGGGLRVGVNNYIL